jgi:hypothetical protein
MCENQRKSFGNTTYSRVCKTSHNMHSDTHYQTFLMGLKKENDKCSKTVAGESIKMCQKHK